MQYPQAAWKSLEVHFCPYGVITVKKFEHAAIDPFYVTGPFLHSKNSKKPLPFLMISEGIERNQWHEKDSG